MSADALPPPYPLAWPEGQRRTQRRVKSQFKTGFAGALKNVRDSLRLFGQDSGISSGAIEIATNATLTNEKPSDPGVAVWFVWDGAVRCVAVDRYQTVAENLQAIHHVIEARRTELRHGGIELVRTTFRGFTALAAPAGSVPWHQVLGVATGSDKAAITAAWRELSRRHHGDEERQRALNVARDQGMKEASS